MINTISIHDVYHPSRVSEIATSMLKRYSSAKMAYEMALLYSNDFDASDRRSIYWHQVANQIKEQSR